MSGHRRWGLALSETGQSVLQRLQQAGLVEVDQGYPVSTSATLLREHWETAESFVVVGAAGAVVRLLAPLLVDKNSDPAVVVVDPGGLFAVPLLGSHSAGGEALAQQVAALLGGQAVLTGASGAMGRLALDSFGSAWGWRKGSGDWDALVKAANRLEPIQLLQEAGKQNWRQLDAAPTSSAEQGIPLVISHRLGDGCRWHPPSLWLGVGCERDTSLSLITRAVDLTLRSQGLAPEAVAGLASAQRKADEPALLALSAQRGWPLQFFEAEQLAVVPVPHPSATVAKTMGTASVAEASALLAAGPEARLLVPKTIERAQGGERGAATVAVAQSSSQWAPHRGRLHLVGSGPGSLELLTDESRKVLAQSTVWVGYGLYLDLLEPLRRPDQLRCDGVLTQERERCRQALELACSGLSVALISSGDSGIYGMAGLALELWLELAPGGRPAFEVHPGISALQLAAARAGAPLMHDFCTISLSDRLTPWETIEQRLRAAALGDFVVALYNPRSLGRDWQLGRAKELLLEGRPKSTPVVIARQLGRQEELVHLSTLGELPVEQIDMLTLVLIGNRSSRQQDGRMVTPRGYLGAELA